jgi:hypothetical protein
MGSVCKSKAFEYAVPVAAIDGHADASDTRLACQSAGEDVRTVVCRAIIDQNNLTSRFGCHDLRATRHKLEE